MTEYTCSALYSISSTKRGFVIPAFNKMGSNDLYFQDLSVHGKVERFLRADTRNLYFVEVLPPALQIVIGELGILAFIDDMGDLQIGSPIHLAHSIDANLVESPVTRIELSSLRGDRQMQKRAIRDCEGKFGGQDRFERWAKREKRLFRRAFEEGAEKEREVDEANRILDAEFLEIEKTLDDPNWPKRWLKLWGKGYDQRKMMGIAYYRQDASITFDVEGPEIFRHILDFERSSEATKRAIRVLADSSLASTSWFFLFIQLYRWNKSSLEELTELGLTKLKEWSDQGRGYLRNWISVWRYLLTFSQARHDLYALAIDYIKSLKYINASVAESLLTPLSKILDDLDPIEDEIVDWLTSVIRSDTTWATLFLNSFPKIKTTQLYDVGVYWLENLGGNLSQWIHVWHLYENEMDDADYTRIAIEWLGRARKDMHVWVEVYTELHTKFGLVDNLRFIQLGADWIQSLQGNAKNRKRMTQLLKYMKVRYEQQLDQE